MLTEHRIVVLHNIVSPYKTVLFNELYKICSGLKVLYIAETETRREWNIEKDDIKFPHEIMFKGAMDDSGFLKPIIKTWERLNSLNPDVIIINGYAHVTCWAGFFWAKSNRKKLILWSASNEHDKERSLSKEKLKGFLVKRCDAANVYGTRSKDYLVKLGMKEDNIFITGNITNNGYYYKAAMKLREDRAILCHKLGIPHHNFLYIGRFSDEKNILRLLYAYKNLSDLNPCTWGLILVGSGPEHKLIESYIKEHSIKNVFLPGFKQKEEIPQYLAVSDVLVLPSISEPWGLVVNEAMAAGLPVLVSERCGCYPDIVIDGSNGFSFNPSSTEELYGLMKNVVEREYDLEKMGYASLEIIKDYTAEKATKIIIETIESVLKGKA
jgi:glycosyltransferase involved in cell wall biosynthesis